jgi:hypothetical protein
MKLLLTGGLNLNDPSTIDASETAISENADYRQDGVVRSRDGRTGVYSSAGGFLIGSANGQLHSFGTDIYRNGVSLDEPISNPVAVGVMNLYNSETEAQFLASDSNHKVIDTDVFQWGISAPSTAPTLALGAAGSLTGDYYYKYTYVRKVAGALIHESNPSPASSVLATTSDWIVVTPTQPSDSQVTHIRFYRTMANGVSTSDDYFYDGEIAVGVTTFTTSSTDTALGSLIETDNDTPPSGITSIAGPGAFRNLFVAAGNKVYYSKPSRPESFPPTYYAEVGSSYSGILALVDWGGLVYAFSPSGIYYLQGNSADTFVPVRTMASTPLVAKHGIKETDKGIFYVGDSGLYAFNGQVEVPISDEKVDSLFRGETVNGVNPINKTYISNCILEYFNGKIFLAYPDANEEFPNKVLMYDLIKKKFSIWNYNITIRSLFHDKLNKRLLAGDSNGNIWRLEYGVDDNGSAFTFKVRSKELVGIEYIAPSTARLDVYNEGGNTVYFRFLQEDSTIYESSFTDSDNHKRRFIAPVSLKSTQFEVESLVSTRVSVGIIDIE